MCYYGRTGYKREQQFKQYNLISFASGEESILQRFNWSTRGIILFPFRSRSSAGREKKKKRRTVISFQSLREFLKILCCDVNNCDILTTTKRKMQVVEIAQIMSRRLSALARCSLVRWKRWEDQRNLFLYNNKLWRKSWNSSKRISTHIYLFVLIILNSRSQNATTVAYVHTMRDSHVCVHAT